LELKNRPGPASTEQQLKGQPQPSKPSGVLGSTRGTTPETVHKKFDFSEVKRVFEENNVKINVAKRCDARFVKKQLQKQHLVDFIKQQPCCPKCGSDATLCDCKFKRPKKVLVGVELNPGPPKGKQGLNRRPAKLKKPATLANRALRQGKLRGSPKLNMRVQMHGPGPKNIRANTGKLGLSMSSGSYPGSTNRRQKICEEDEFIANISGSSSTTAFTISQTLAVNPGQALTFPWLAAEAARYNEYEWEYLEFYYKRTVSEFGTAGTQGKVLLYFDTDATGPAPVVKQQIEDSVYHNDGMPCDPVIRLPIDIQRLRKNDSKYIRTGAQPANTDLKTFDSGNFYCAVDSTANTSTIGELRVRYRVRFTCPILTSAAANGGVVHFSSITSTTADNFAGSVLQAGATPYMANITVASNIITFPAGIPGNYMLTMNIAAGTSASAISRNTQSAGIDITTNVFTNAAVRDSIDQVYSVASTTINEAIWVQYFKVAAGGGTMTINAATLVTSGTASMDLFIFALPVTTLTVEEKEQKEIDVLKSQMKRQQNLLDDLISRVNNPLKAHASCDSDFEEEKEGPSSFPPRDNRDMNGPLSRSTADLIGELIARKSNLTSK